MLLLEINDPKIAEFIEANKDKDLSKLALSLAKKKYFPKDYILNQINGIQKARKKLPFLSDHPNFIYGSPKNVSQSSSEITAKYKANLYQGELALDLSGGMGIDSIFFASAFNKVEYIEKDKAIYDISTTNFKALNLKNIKTYNDDASNHLNNTINKYNLIYLDPDRKIATKKVFLMEDCEPNLMELFPLIKELSANCLIKLSPLIDIQSIFSKLSEFIDIHIVSVKNDCKEVLVAYPANGDLICVNHNGEKWERTVFNREVERNTKVSFSDPLKYLYEPNASIMKAGGFKHIAMKYKLNKIATNTHLYTSDALIEDFPGKKIEVKSVVSSSKSIKGEWNIIVRNFGKDVNWIKKKYKIKEGGTNYLYAFRNQENKALLVQGNRL